MRFFQHITLVLLILLAKNVLAFGEKAQIGKPAPDFSVKNHLGQTVNFKDFAGKLVVLEWYSSVCPCTNDHYATKNMQALQKKYTEQGVVWLTISSHATDKMGSLSADLANSKILGEYHATPTHILLDHDGKMGTDYGAESTPHMFVIDTNGTLIYKGALDNKTADASTYDPLKSRNFLVEALDAAINHKPVSVAVTQAYGCSIKYPVNSYTLKN